MDELRIETAFLTTIIRKIIRKVAKKKLGVDIGLNIDKLRVTIPSGEDTARLHLEADVDISKKDLMHLLGKYI